MSIVQYVLGIMGTLLSWVLMKNCGRRTLYVDGLAVLTVVNFITGCLALGLHFDSAGKVINTNISWGIGSMLLIQTFVFDVSLGPVCYSLVPELAAGRLRSKSTVFARNFYNLFGIVNNVLTPFMLNPTAWNWGAKTGFFWAGITFLCFVWTFFRLPEPKDRTYAELDALFEMKVPARKFSSTEVDPFALHPVVNLNEKETDL